MAPEELKTLPKGNFILAKTGVCPMKQGFLCFLNWVSGLRRFMKFPEQAARGGCNMADRLELEEEIVRRSDLMRKTYGGDLLKAESWRRLLF